MAMAESVFTPQEWIHLYNELLRNKYDFSEHFVQRGLLNIEIELQKLGYRVVKHDGVLLHEIEPITETEKEQPGEPCYLCGTHVPYESMGNGEEWAMRKCAYCDRVVCEKDSITDETGYTCCTSCQEKGT